MREPGEFEASTKGDLPPAGLTPPLLALWHAARDEWDRAHEIAQEDEEDPDRNWVHAHLHRVEGDLDNARYWYRRAGRRGAEGDLGAERRAITEELLRRPG